MEMYVTGLGLAAYAKMHGYKIKSVTKTDVVFDVESNDVENFKNLLLDFVNSECSVFDTWVTCLKKIHIADTIVENTSVKKIDGIGFAAFMKQKASNKWHIVSRINKNIFAFYVPESYENDFYAMQIAWTNSKERNFNAAVLTITDYQRSCKINKWK